MNWTKYIRIPFNVVAIQWTGENLAEIIEFTHNSAFLFPDPETQEPTKQLLIRTVDYNWLADPGDWIICPDPGEFHVMSPDSFKVCYRLYNEENLRSIKQ